MVVVTVHLILFICNLNKIVSVLRKEGLHSQISWRKWFQIGVLIRQILRAHVSICNAKRFSEGLALQQAQF